MPGVKRTLTAGDDSKNPYAERLNQMSAKQEEKYRRTGRLPGESEHSGPMRMNHKPEPVRSWVKEAAAKHPTLDVPLTAYYLVHEQSPEPGPLLDHIAKNPELQRELKTTDLPEMRTYADLERWQRAAAQNPQVAHAFQTSVNRQVNILNEAIGRMERDPSTAIRRALEQKDFAKYRQLKNDADLAKRRRG